MQVNCESCGKEYDVLEISITRNKARNDGRYWCASCKIRNSPPRPQNTAEFWAAPELRAKLSNSIKNSQAHKESRKIVSAKMRGELNHNFGKTASAETRQKMSRSRTGKTGKNATAWKGGRASLSKLIRGHIKRKHNWGVNIFKRDNYKCAECGSTEKIHAHHIIPFSQIVDSIIKANPHLEFLPEDEKATFIADQPELTAADGKTLCLKCHKAVHKNWGSHGPNVKE